LQLRPKDRELKADRRDLRLVLTLQRAGGWESQ
jgi:hypothetical protein